MRFNPITSYNKEKLLGVCCVQGNTEFVKFNETTWCKNREGNVLGYIPSCWELV